MALLQKTKICLALIAAFGMSSAVPALAEQGDNTGLASTALAGGHAVDAVELLRAELERDPNDPALLINLGIAYAQMGDEAAAQSHFKAALTSPEVIELDTADGRTTNSRRLARQAMVMLERGEFQPDRVAAKIEN